MELGTGLALVAFADQCLKYGNKFIKRCKSYLHAEEESIELLVSIESNWMKMETQIKILKQIAPGLNKELQDMQSQILSQLEGKLKTASLTMEQLMKEKREEEKTKELWRHDDRDIGTMIKGLGEMTGLKKVKYANKKASLLQIVDEIERWQARYDPSWILIMQMSIGNIDEELDKQQKKPDKDQIPIVIAAKGIRDAARERQDGNIQEQRSIWIDADEFDLKPSPLPFSSVNTSLADEKDMVLVDTMISHPAAYVNRTIKDVRNLARLLAKVEPTIFGLLKCRGVIKLPRQLPYEVIFDFNFIFEVPQNLSNPRSLRAVLLAKDSYPLDERLELAKRLTSSVLFVHTVQFVHKNIRPETIIIFENDDSKIGAQFLAGFEQFRIGDGLSYRAGDEKWEHNLCMYIVILLNPLTSLDRHPSRQGLHPEMNYEMQHDIFSLGVVLLEIGLWSSFVVYDSDGQSPSPEPNSILGPKSESQSSPIGGAISVKYKLETLAKSELPARMGKRYTEIVLLCLKCLDTGTGTDGNGKGFGVDVPSWEDEDGIVIGVRYIENILEKIQEIMI